MEHTKYPYTIDNGHGELLTFTGVTQGPERRAPGGRRRRSAGRRSADARALPSGRGRPRRARDDSGIRSPGGEPQFAGPGELVVWPAGTPHKWWNAGSDELHMYRLVQSAGQRRVLPRHAVRVDEGERRHAAGPLRCRLPRDALSNGVRACSRLPAFVRRIVIPARLLRRNGHSGSTGSSRMLPRRFLPFEARRGSTRRR